MALDIQMLEPLEFLSTSQINKESCAEAELLNEMNSSSDVKTFQKVKESIQSLCSTQNQTTVFKGNLISSAVLYCIDLKAFSRSTSDRDNQYVMPG